MKKIDFNNDAITDVNLLALNKRGFAFMQDSYTEMIIGLAKSKIDNYDINTPYAIWGCNNLSGNKIEQGLILYNNNLYFADESIFTVGAGTIYIQIYDKTLDDLNSGVLTAGSPAITEYSEQRIRFVQTTTTILFSSLVYLDNLIEYGSNVTNNTLDFRNNSVQKNYIINSNNALNILLKDSLQSQISYLKEINIYVYNQYTAAVNVVIGNSTIDGLPTGSLNNFTFPINQSIGTGALYVFKFAKIYGVDTTGAAVQYYIKVS